MAGAHADEPRITARDRLRVHEDRRGVVRQTVEFFRTHTIRIHRPNGLRDASAFVNVLPAMVHHAAIVEHNGAELADGASRELYDMRAICLHTVQARCDEVRRPATQDRMFTTSGREDDVAIRQVTGMNIVRVPTGTPARNLFSFVGRRKRNLPQSRAIDADFPNPESRIGILTEIEQHFARIEREADLADKTTAAR